MSKMRSSRRIPASFKDKGARRALVPRPNPLILPFQRSRRSRDTHLGQKGTEADVGRHATDQAIPGQIQPAQRR